MHFEKAVCNASGHFMAYNRQGKGETVIFVHGITTYSFIWRNILPLLSSDYDVISVDLLGCGESDKPLDVSYSLKDHADRLYNFTQTLGISRFHYVGHDLGGGIGQIFAVRHERMLYDLTLINSVAYDFWPVQPITAMRTPIIRQLLMTTFDFGTFKLIIKRGIHHIEKIDRELLDLFNKPMQTGEGRKAFLHFAKCLDNSNLMEISEELRAMEIPVLIIRGDADVYLSSSIAEKLHSEIKTSRLVRIQTGGHFIQEDHPEWIASELSRFYAEQ
jgi:pimeloyl-ACP methyl ester carboxylesterase